MMPPNVTGITAAADAAFEQDRKDAESYRLIGQAGWKLVRISDLEVLLEAATNLTRLTSEFNARHRGDGA